ncbi:invasin domain 3-containing protein [Paenibacillus sonchi]|uniref:invasin domain 3-containing protein n=1 Tax=Paenibacillus sonchi TaxID=373687 RepID=UPI001E2D4ED5|nr:S-layer homology domain-containing protein [Paenibacillus sonchi]
MKGIQRYKRWLALTLIFMVLLGPASEGYVSAADPMLLDQKQENATGNVWVNSDYGRYQTFTPAITGNLSRIDLNIMDTYGSPGALKLKIYKESGLSTLLAEAQLASYSPGWVSVDFSGASPYLQKDTMYRMVASTEFGGSSGFGWYGSSGSPYPRGYSAAANYDFSFRTYMIADYSTSPALSEISSAESSLVADGTSQTTVTVKLKDAQGNALTAGGAAVTVAATQGTVSPVTDNHNGTYTATLTAPTTAGTATVSATVGGAALTETATVQFVAGTPSIANSTVESGDASLTADGTSQTTVTVKLKDAQGNALTTGGAAVTVAATQGTVSPVRDNHNGTYTATLTAPTTAGAATISATVGGAALTETAAVQFVAGSPSIANSTVESGDASLTADGTSQTTVTVKLKDAQGNALTAGGATVGITSTSGTVGPVTDNHNGTYTATLTAPTTAGTVTVSATVGGAALTETATVQFVAGTPSIANSTVESGDASLTADGTSQTTVTVKLKDAQGNALTAGGATVGITSTSGTVGPVTDNHNGTYTATLTAPITAGTATVSATVGGAALTETATVQFVAGTPSIANSTVESGDASLTADGTSQTTVTVKLKDAQGNALTTGGATVGITSTSGTVGPVTDNHNGTYTATLTAPTTAGTATVSATVGGVALTETATVQFVAGSPSFANSTIELVTSSLTADGTSQTAVTVKLKDAQGNALTAGGAVVLITSTLGTVSTVTDNHNGTYTATLTAPTTVGTAKISATADGSALASTVTVQLLPGEVSSFHSTVTASDLVVRADGKSQALIYVKLKDEYGHPLAGKRVQLQAQDGSSVIKEVYGSSVSKEVYGLTNAEGLAAFAVSNVVAEKVTYSAKEESGLLMDQTVDITFTYDQPPVIKLQVDSAAPTFSSVRVAVYASVYGEYNSISSIKWAAGSRPVSYFDTEGTPIKDHFTVQENGIYSVYAADTAGNANVSLIEIQNIVPLSSNSNLMGWQLIGLGGTVKFDFDAGKLNNTLEVSDSVYGLKMLLTPANVYAAVSVNDLQVDSNVPTREYVLATGPNKFEIRVKAQDGSIKTYTLNVIRSAASKVPDSGSVPGSPSVAPGPSSQPSPGNAPVVWINDKKVTGLATRKVNADGAKAIDVLLNMDNLSQVLDSLSNTAEANLSISVEEEADQLALRLTGSIVPILAGKTAVITIKTQFGQYRLPLAEMINRETTWSNDVEARIIIERGKRETGLQVEANINGFQLATDPVHFNVLVTGNGKKKEVTGFNHYVERVIYLPENAGAASTAILWDQNSGVRPVPTEFTIVDGHRAAVIRSLTNSTYVVVSKTSPLTDIQGHWAEAEISRMSNRMIVQGTEGGRFAPEAEVTRAELAAMLARALGLPEGDNSAGFRDVNGLSWYSGAVAAVKASGIMNGFSDGSFRPDQKVSRQEAIVTIMRALRVADAAPASNIGVQVDLSLYTDSSQIGGWASEALRTAIYEGLMKGYGNELRPQQALTRAETTVLLHRMLLQAGLING